MYFQGGPPSHAAALTNEGAVTEAIAAGKVTGISILRFKKQSTLRRDLDDVRWHGVLHGNQSGKKRIARERVSDCSGKLQNSHGSFGDLVALNFIIVAFDQDGGLPAIGDVIAAG